MLGFWISQPNPSNPLSVMELLLWGELAEKGQLAQGGYPGGTGGRPTSSSLGGPHFPSACWPLLPPDTLPHPRRQHPRRQHPQGELLPSAGPFSTALLLECLCISSGSFLLELLPSLPHRPLSYPFHFSYHLKFRAKKMMVQNHQEQFKTKYQPAQPWTSVSPSLPFRVLWVRTKSHLRPQLFHSPHTHSPLFLSQDSLPPLCSSKPPFPKSLYLSAKEEFGPLNDTPNYPSNW